MRMLINRVMATVKRSGADVEALLVGDLFRCNEARRVASARGGDSGVERMRERIPKGDAGRGGINVLAGMRAVEHARLGSHVGRLFYTRGHVQEIRKAKLGFLCQPPTDAEFRISHFRVSDSEEGALQLLLEMRPTFGSRHHARKSNFEFRVSLLLGGAGFGGSVGVFLGEALDAPGGVHQL